MAVADKVVRSGAVDTPVTGRHRASLRELLSTTLVAVWTGSQVIAVLPGLPFGVFQQLVAWKSLIAAFAVGSLLLLVLARLSVSRFNLPFLVFSVWCALGVMAREQPDLPQSAMILLWALATFVAFPAAFSTPRACERMIRSMLWLISATLLVALAINLRGSVELQVISKGGWYGERQRLTMGVGNAVYFAKAAGAVVVGALLLWPFAYNRRTKLLMGAIAAAGACLVVATDTRAMMVFLATTFGCYLRLSARRWLRYAGGVVIAIGLIIGVLAATEVSYEQVNDYSSGRVQLWRELTERTLGNDTAQRVLVGAGEIDWGPLAWERGIQHSGGTVSMMFQHLRADSVYVEVFLRHGIIGLVLLLWAGWSFVSRAGMARRAVLAQGNTRLATAIGAAQSVFLGTAALCFFDSAVPSLGNVFNAFAFPAVAAICALGERWGRAC